MSRSRMRRGIAISTTGLVLAAAAVALGGTAAAVPVTVIDAGLVRTPSGQQLNALPVGLSPQTPAGGITAPLRVVPLDPTPGCEAADFAGQDFTGTVALIERGGCTLDQKQLNAAAAGAVVVIITNDLPGTTGALLGSPGVLPMGTVSPSDGDVLATLAGQAVTVDLRYHTENLPPTADDDTYRTGRDTQLVVTGPGVLDGDAPRISGPTLTAIGLDTTATAGSVTLGQDGGFTYTPAPGFVGTDTFTYRAFDGTDASAPATVSIIVEAPPRPTTCEPTPTADAIVGTEGSDTIVGTPGDDVIYGLAGNDDIDGGGGNDLICAGAGNDRANGGAGDDIVVGQADNDTLTGGEGDDTLDGGDGNDSLDGQDGADTLSGGDGNDALRGGAGSDALAGQAGNDSLDGGAGVNAVNGGPGRNSCRNPARGPGCP